MSEFVDPSEATLVKGVIRRVVVDDRHLMRRYATCATWDGSQWTRNDQPLAGCSVISVGLPVPSEDDRWVRG